MVGILYQTSGTLVTHPTPLQLPLDKLDNFELRFHKDIFFLSPFLEKPRHGVPRYIVFRKFLIAACYHNYRRIRRMGTVLFSQVCVCPHPVVVVPHPSHNNSTGPMSFIRFPSHSTSTGPVSLLAGKGVSQSQVGGGGIPWPGRDWDPPPPLVRTGWGAPAS